MRKINKTGLDKIKEWEGLRLSAYLDSAGIWTIGYGHTAAAGEPKPKQGMTITEQQAEDILVNDLTQYENAVSSAVTVALTDNQFAALVSMCYNIGIGAFKNSTLVKKLNKGDYDAVPEQMMRWTKTNGKTFQGLVNRRSNEVALWSSGQQYSGEKPTKNKLDFKKPEVIASAGGAASALGVFASGNSPVQWAVAAVLVLFAVAAVFYWFKKAKL